MRVEAPRTYSLFGVFEMMFAAHPASVVGHGGEARTERESQARIAALPPYLKEDIGVARATRPEEPAAPVFAGRG